MSNDCITGNRCLECTRLVLENKAPIDHAADDEARRDITAKPDPVGFTAGTAFIRPATPEPFYSEGAGGAVDDLYGDSRGYTVRAPRNLVTDPDTRTDADALRDTQNHHQGSRVHAADADHARQLRRAGLIGRRSGLTRKGSIAAQRVRDAALDDAFGVL